MAPNNFSGIFSQPDLNRNVGAFLGADAPGLGQQGRMCLASKALAGHNRVRVWCLRCLWRWQWGGWSTVIPNPGNDFPFGWSAAVVDSWGGVCD